MTVLETTKDIRQREWDFFLHSIEVGDCVLVLGPDLDVLSGRNLARDLSQELAAIFEEETGDPAPDPQSLSLVCQSFENEIGRDMLEFNVLQFMESYHATLPQQNDQIFETLAKLPFSTVVTSRHDRTLANFLERAGRAPVLQAYDFEGNQIDSLGNLGTPEAPLLYELYGSLDEPGSLVLTEADHLRFLRAVVAESPKIPDDLKNLFKEKNFLFLGFGLGNYNLRVLMHVIGLSKRSRSFALEPNPGQHEDSVLFYGQLGYRALKILGSEVDVFMSELDEKWTARHPDGFEYSASAPQVSAASEGPMPSLFISYVSEDLERAERIAELLRVEGIDPWIDKSGLSSGAIWDDTLEDVISNDVNFFMVLQSHALQARQETYVLEEVRLALNRSRKFKGTFIYPVLLDEGAELLELLTRAKIQTGNLFDLEEEIPKLALSMKRQFAKLRRG